MADFDAEFVWHPYSSLTEPQPTYHVTGAKGARLYLDDGRELIDGVSSWWACCHGYGNEHLINKITEQLNKLSHVMFAGIRHDAATELVMRLKAILPQELKYVFLADSGSVAVEIAMKMAVQYQSSVNPRRTKFLTVRGGYHGDTMATMSVTDPGTGFSAEYQQYIPQQFFIERPAIPFNDEWKQEAIEPLESFLSAHHDEIAAFILEPVMQGAGGMYFYHPMYLREARRLCSQYDVIMICDEIATGFGRTGRMFACEHAGIVPDIMTLGKGLTGGMMTLSAVAASEKIKDGIALSPARVLMHGPTFMANPLACAAALGSLDLLENNNVCEKTVHIQNVLEDGLRSISGLDVVREVRVLGACGVVELKFPVDTVRMQAFLVNHGVWLRPFGNIIYIYPPFIISDDELKKCIEAVKILVYRLERGENY
ncbi:MAG: adenosylmethionine--8-amino-7-oxononanoate transaminase [Ruminobacter sp.]|nr:adenosylmethionine--8-amino-7-oxononanoate transaminase [Ruminobacter sp.]